MWGDLMSGELWALLAGVSYGLFQTFHRRAGKEIDIYRSTFALLIISVVILAIACLLTEDINLLWKSPFNALLNFGFAGFLHFFAGWTLLSISQRRVGAARTVSLVGSAPLFAVVFAALALGEFVSFMSLMGIILIVTGVYFVANG